MAMMRQSVLPLVSCAGLWYAFHSIVMSPLRISAAEMAHMDPTEIIAVPFPLETVGLYCGCSSVILFLVSTTWWEPRALLRELWNTGQATLTIYLLFILCGTHPMEKMEHTLWAGLYMASLTYLSPSTCSSFRTALRDRIQFLPPKLASCRFYGTLLITMPLQILYCYDWGSQIQRWPLPMMIGSTYGWIVGTICGVILELATARQETKPRLAAVTKKV